MSTEAMSSEPTAFHRWVRATTLGWLLGFVLVVVLSIAWDQIGGGAQFIVGVGMGAGVGIMQARVVGEWVNLGAGTTTSNLKNTYGPVRLDVAGAAIETGHMFLGSLIGDHAKTAIGTLLGTGTVVGAGASVFNGVRAPKWVPPFSWGGDGSDLLRRDGFLAIVERVLPRRNVEVDDAMRAYLERMYDWLTR